MASLYINFPCSENGQPVDCEGTKTLANAQKNRKANT